MLLQLEPHRLQLSPYRPRQPLPWPRAEEIELIRELGFVEPITARPLPQTDPPQYEIVAGEKHWLAAQKAGLAKIPVLVLNTIPVLVLNTIDEDTAQRLQVLQAVGVRNDPSKKHVLCSGRSNVGRLSLTPVPRRGTPAPWRLICWGYYGSIRPSSN